MISPTGGIRSTICSAVLARLAIACASLAIVVYSSAPFASTSSEQSSTSITESVRSTSARSGLSRASYSSSAMVIASMVTGSTRVRPQMNRIRGYFSRGIGCAGGSSPPSPPMASPMASMAAPMRPASLELGSTIFSSAASCGPMPNSLARALSSSSMSTALKCALRVIFSKVFSPAWVVSRWVAPVGRGGICRVRDSVSGLNWKITMFGIGPISPAPYSIMAPRRRSMLTPRWSLSGYRDAPRPRQGVPSHPGAWGPCRSPHVTDRPGDALRDLRRQAARIGAAALAMRPASMRSAGAACRQRCVSARASAGPRARAAALAVSGAMPCRSSSRRPMDSRFIAWSFPRPPAARTRRTGRGC